MAWGMIPIGGRLSEIDEARATVRVRRPDEMLVAYVDIEEGRVELPAVSTRRYHPIESFDDVMVVNASGRPIERRTTNARAPGPPWQVQVKTRRSITLRGAEISAAARVNLIVRGGDRPPTLDGRVEVLGGRVDLFGNLWQVQQAELIFPGRKPPDPDLAVVLEKRFEDDVSVTLRLDGSLAAPKLELSSEPPIYDRPQLLAYVLTGAPGDRSEGPSADKASTAAIDFLLGQIRRDLEDRLPVDTLKLDLGDNARVAQVEVGKWLSDTLFLAYGFRPEAGDDENANEVTLRWRLTDDWILEGFYGDEDNGGADLFWTKRF